MMARRLTLAAASLMVALAGCADLPRDQKGSTDKIRAGRVLVVGISREKSEPSEMQKREQLIVKKVAQRLGAKVKWQPGNAHQLLLDLEEVKLPIVAASITSDSPFAERVGLSQPFLKDGPNHKDYCLAVAPGENKLLLLVDQIIAEEQRDKS